MPVERRRYIRHKVHSPAYASVGNGAGGVVLDANEHGAAVQVVSRPAVQSIVDLRLDLLETRSSVAAPARVAWSDQEGRAGLEFLNLTGESRRQLQQWLLLNTLVAAESASALLGSKRHPETPATTVEDFAPDPALVAVAEYALAITGANGAAVALAEHDSMLCRATAGEIAPPLGARLDTQSGISGACVRSGHSLLCNDPQFDPYVDRESCRALGINSVLAAPILHQAQVIGLVEVFSRQACAFDSDDCGAVEKLAASMAALVRKGERGAAQPSPSVPASVPADAAKMPAVEVASKPTAISEIPSSKAPEVVPLATSEPARASLVTEESDASALVNARTRAILLGLLIVLTAMGLWFSVTPRLAPSVQTDAVEAAHPQTAIVPQTAGLSQNLQPAAATPASALPPPLEGLRQQAEHGDAEAQFELGAAYAGGNNVPQDYAEAVKWFTRAAEGGQVLAAATLGAYYWTGNGISRDDIRAYMWTAIAKAGGDEAARYRLARLQKRMTHAEVAEAEQSLDAWLQTHPALVSQRNAPPDMTQQ